MGVSYTISMNFDDFSYTENDRRYINPQVSLDEQNAFIDNLRGMQKTNTAQIAQNTRNLGTQVPSNLGGLTGGTSYFTSRYQTPQTNSMVSDLKATAQASALSTLMNNEIAKAQKQYNDAYRAAKKRAAKSGGGGGSGSTLKDLLDALEVDLTNDNGAGDKQDIEQASDESLVSSPSREALLENARTKQRIWERQLASWKNKNPVEALWTMDEMNNASAQVKKWADEVARLEAMGN